MSNILENTILYITMKSKRFVTTLFVIFIMVTVASAKNEVHYQFRHVDYNDKLSSKNVKCITEDSYGFVWLGTKNGLHRYDGTTINRIRCYDYAKRHGNDNIGAICEDTERKLWVGTDRGIYLYDPVVDNFSYVERKDLLSGHIAQSWVQSIVVDDHGNIWALLPDQGVFRYYSDKVDFYSVIPQDGNIKDVHITNMCIDYNGDVWIATSGAGVYCYDRARNFFYKIAPVTDIVIDNIKFVTLAEDTDGTLIFVSTDGCLFRYDPLYCSFSEITFSHSGNIFVRCLICFDDEIWIGTQNGLYVTRKADMSTIVLRHDPLIPYSIADNTIYFLYKSRSGDAWVGTTYGGADYMLRRKFKFEVWGQWTGLDGRIISGIAQESGGNIWIGTEDAGLFVLNPQTGIVETAEGIPADCQHTLFLKRYGDSLYAGFARGGLLCISDSGSIKSVLDIPEADNSVYAYLKDSRGNEWVGLGYALYCRNTSSKEFIRINETGFCWIFDIFEASDGTVWIATMGNGVWTFNPSTRRFRNYCIDTNPDIGLHSDNISSIFEDSRCCIWISTDRGGISRYNANQDNFTSFGIDEGLPDEVAYKILEDDYGNLWFGSNKGLTKFNLDTYQVHTFTTKDGLISNIFNYGAALKDEDGCFYFGGTGGITTFNPNIKNSQQVSTSIYFTSLKVFGQEVTVATKESLLTRNIMFTDCLTLPYDKATFALDVAIPNIEITGNNYYTYRLMPLNTEWVRMVGNQISFLKLSPGKYKLSVRADIHGQTTVREIAIMIHPPWFKSTLAYVIYVILFICVVWMSYSLYRRHKKRQFHEYQRLFEVSKEKELYRAKVDFFTEVAHEIKTPLTLISAPLEAIEKNDMDSEMVQHYQKVIRQNVERLLNLTEQLLDFQSINDNRLALKYENIDVRALISNTVYSFEPAFTLRGRKLEKNIGDGSMTILTDREAIIKIISNLLNNALKYGRCVTKISLTTDDEWLMIKVTSDGDKITGNERRCIFEPFYQMNKSIGESGIGLGLALSSSLASMLGGSLTLDDDLSPENTFTLTIPLNGEGTQNKDKQLVWTPEYVINKNTNEYMLSSVDYTVLIVEDNDDMRDFLAEQVDTLFSSERACNGQEALDKLAKSRIDLIVTDIMMPVMDGFEMCRRIKEDIDISHIPIIIITAKNDLDSKIKGLQLGAEAYIEKPFSVRYFCQLMSSLLENRRRERELFSKKPFFNADNMHMVKADEDLINKMIKIIEDNMCKENFNVETMANMLCMSHSKLSRKLKSVFNISPLELIRTVKLKKAASLIHEGKHQIGDICYMIGFSSPSYFSKLFLNQFGITPKDFEKRCRKKKSKVKS